MTCVETAANSAQLEDLGLRHQAKPMEPAITPLQTAWNVPVFFHPNGPARSPSRLRDPKPAPGPLRTSSPVPFRSFLRTETRTAAGPPHPTWVFASDGFGAFSEARHSPAKGQVLTEKETRRGDCGRWAKHL